MNWVRVWAGRSVAEATLVRDSLDHAGIGARIAGANRSALAGEIPFSETMAEVLVESSSASAAAIVLARLVASEGAADWTCAACGEENPGTFELCWSCARAR